jgi:hypothetical protein
MIVIDTIGKLHAFGNRVFGHCRPCAARYRMDLRPETVPPSSLEIDLPALIAERRAASASWTSRGAAIISLPCPIV